MAPKKEIENIVEFLSDLQEDNYIPKNIKESIIKVIGILKQECEIAIKINKALNELDDVADDPNLEPYTRTQIWNVVSMLEKIE